MKNQLLVYLAILLTSCNLNAQQIEPFSIGDRVTMHSVLLDEDRVLNVYLPHSYTNDSILTYPVIYLLDGSANEDFIHISGLVQFGSYSWINMIPESIVVGIENVDRTRDFTSTTRDMDHLRDYPQMGGSEQFIKFLTEEVQPHIERHYRTNGTNTLIGQSLGGLLATEILFKIPSSFNNYIIISPSLWYDFEYLLGQDPQDLSAVNSIYIGVGKEGKIMEKVSKKLFKKIKKLKLDKTRINFQFFPKHDHGDVLHQAVYDAFDKTFTLKS